jgi:hypothetical protein
MLNIIYEETIATSPTSQLVFNEHFLTNVWVDRMLVKNVSLIYKMYQYNLEKEKKRESKGKRRVLEYYYYA